MDAPALRAELPRAETFVRSVGIISLTRSPRLCSCHAMSALRAPPKPNPAAPAGSSASSVSSSTTAGSSPPRSAAIPTRSAQRYRPDPRAHHPRPAPCRGARSQDHPQRRPSGRRARAAAPCLPPPIAARPRGRPPTDTAASGPSELAPAHARADRRRGPPPPDRRRHRRHLPRSRHQAEPSVVAGTARRHRPLWRQPGQAGEGHLRSDSASRLARPLGSALAPALQFQRVPPPTRLIPAPLPMADIVGSNAWKRKDRKQVFGSAVEAVRRAFTDCGPATPVSGAPHGS